jgi:uncharacterized protein YraI
MKSMTRLYKLSVFVSLLVMALAASASLASAQEGVQAIPNRLTLVYQEPGSTGEVVAVFTPSMRSLEIVGRDESGAYLAVAIEHGMGWVSAGELELRGDIAGLPVIAAQAQPEPAGSLQAMTTVLTKVYTGPEFGYAITDIRMPQEKLQVLGRSADSRWLAIALEHGQGWVSAGELELRGDIAGLPVIATQAQLEPAGSPQAVTAVLTKVYTGPGFSYAITDILMAQEKLQVLGRSADSRWLAVRRPGDEAAATGWIPAGEARLNISLASLPVIRV